MLFRLRVSVAGFADEKRARRRCPPKETSTEPSCEACAGAIDSAFRSESRQPREAAVRAGVRLRGTGVVTIEANDEVSRNQDRNGASTALLRARARPYARRQRFTTERKRKFAQCIRAFVATSPERWCPRCAVACVCRCAHCPSRVLEL